VRAAQAGDGRAMRWREGEPLQRLKLAGRARKRASGARTSARQI
jgi:hypothetical protein